MTTAISSAMQEVESPYLEEPGISLAVAEDLSQRATQTLFDWLKRTGAPEAALTLLDNALCLQHYCADLSKGNGKIRCSGNYLPEEALQIYDAILTLKGV